MTENPNRRDDRPPRDEAPGNELHGLIEPDLSHRIKDREALEYVEAMRPKLLAREERAERYYFGEDGKERSRRTRIYSHNWIIEKEDYQLTPVIAQDAICLAENCDFELMLSADCPELDPKFGPDLIAFNGRGDACDDFTYPPDRTDPRVSNFLGNRGKCRTECRDYDTLVSAVLLSVKHHLGNRASVRSTAEPDHQGWQAAKALYSRTFPKREIPWLDNWPREHASA